MLAVQCLLRTVQPKYACSISIYDGPLGPLLEYKLLNYYMLANQKGSGMATMWKIYLILTPLFNYHYVKNRLSNANALFIIVVLIIK